MLNGYVKRTSNTPQGIDLGWDADLTVLEELGCHQAARVRTGEDLVVRRVVGWSDLFGGTSAPLNAYRAQWQGQTGILLCGANSGLRILANDGEDGDKNKHLTPGWGTPILWIEDEDDLIGFVH